MSNKLKIMQEPVSVSTAEAKRSRCQTEDTMFYRFDSCGMHTYYVEVDRHTGLTAAIARLKAEFNVDCDRYCKGCDGPVIHTISIVPHEDVPAESDGLLISMTPLVSST